MKIEVDVKRAEQSWDFDTGQSQNYLVVDVLGIEVKVPCDEDHLQAAIAELSDYGPTADDYGPPPVDENERIPAPATFVNAPPQEDEPEIATFVPRVAQRKRELKPLQREVGDDVGIAQG